MTVSLSPLPGDLVNSMPATKEKRRKGPVEFVFDAHAAGKGCAQVVSKKAAKLNKKKRREKQRERAVRAKLGLLQTDDEKSKEAQDAKEAETFDRNKVWRSIRALSASQLKGWKLREWQEQQRRELGAKATKNKKMPLKMRTGILKKRKIVQARVQARIKEAGVVTANHKGNKAKRQRKKFSGANSGDVGDAGVRDGVMNVRYLLKR